MLSSDQRDTKMPSSVCTPVEALMRHALVLALLFLTSFHTGALVSLGSGEKITNASTYK